MSRGLVYVLARLKRSFSPLLGEFALLAFSTVLLQGMRFITSLVAAKLLGPSVWGLWYLLNLVLVYGPNVQLGVLNAMNRDVPLYKGRADLTKVERIRSATLGFTLLSTAVAVLVMVLWGVFFVPDQALKVSYMHLLPLFTLGQVHIWLQFYLRSDLRFNLVSRQQIWLALLWPLILPLTFKWGLPGYIWGQSLVILVMLILIVCILPIDIRPRLDWPEIRRLIRVGFPILLVGLLFSLLSTLDRWIVAVNFDRAELGQYAMALLLVSVLNLLPNTVSEQMYPRMAETWGRNRQIEGVWVWVKRQVYGSVGLVLAVILPVAVLAPGIMRQFLPEYLPGLPALYPLLLCPLALALSGGFANMLNTVDYQRQYLLVQVVSLPLLLGLALGAIQMGWGMAGVAWAVAATYWVFALLLSASGWWVQHTLARGA